MRLDPLELTIRDHNVTGAHDLLEFIKQHEETSSGKKVLYARLDGEQHTEKLLIVMSTHNHGDRYMALRSFTENQVCDLLFVTDPNNTWYLDQDNGESFQRVISHYIKNYKPENTFLFGSSMSGYGAILHALKLDLNAIAFNPQINLDITKNYAWPELIEHIDNLNGNHTKIEDIVHNTWKNSAIYLIHGHDDIDVINATLFTNAQPDQKKLIVQTINIESHVLNLGNSADYTYDLINVLLALRTGPDLSSITEKITTDAKNLRRSLRLERENAKCFDPFRSLCAPNKGALWQYRHDYKETNIPIFFNNTGFYRGSSLSGTTCNLNKASWQLVTPTYNKKYNLIESHQLDTAGEISSSTDDFFINDHWKLRNKSQSTITINGQQGQIEIDVQDPRDTNIYLHSSVTKPVKLNALAGQFLTFTADVFSSQGEASITLGGVGNFGYHHKNSEKSVPGEWTQLIVFEQFLSVNKSHKDKLFVRFNLASDGKSKVVKIKNICLTIGYFPMGFSEIKK
ncbi:hypothetical protein [Pseudomonas sp. Irchel 3H3]|uniref:hypothetical protein n=1 Tax=Pseudomonas sp. Irchel 3H3 TaxID=2009038 RepID=UPI0015A9ACB7|nr:hypothetical protein [Pseudomonas sp. Irchel 3H3]